MSWIFSLSRTCPPVVSPEVDSTASQAAVKSLVITPGRLRPREQPRRASVFMVTGQLDRHSV